MWIYDIAGLGGPRLFEKEEMRQLNGPVIDRWPQTVRCRDS